MLWVRLEPLPSVRVPKLHPLGRHWRRIASWEVLNAILIMLRTG